MSDKLTQEDYEAIESFVGLAEIVAIFRPEAQAKCKVIRDMLDRRKPDPPPVQFHAAAFFVNPCDATRSRLWDALRVDHGWGIMAIRGQPILIRALPEDEFGRKAIAIA